MTTLKTVVLAGTAIAMLALSPVPASAAKCKKPVTGHRNSTTMIVTMTRTTSVDVVTVRSRRLAGPETDRTRLISLPV